MVNSLVRENSVRGKFSCAPTLDAKLAPWMQAFIKANAASGAVVHGLLKTYGSPAHLVVTSEFQRNASDLLAPFKARKLDGGLYFARKANKLPWFVTAAKESGIGVDTASLQEVRETLQLGVPAKDIIVTAVGKSLELVTEAVKAGCLVVIENEDEIQLLQTVAESLNCTARVGVRFAGFQTRDRIVYSRFGLSVNEFPAVLGRVFASNCLQLELLHAHLDRYDVDERAAAARKLIEIRDWAASVGHTIRAIDLGGGILIRYLNSEEQWKSFQEALTAGVRGERSSCTFRGDGLGYFMHQGQLLGQADLYPAFNNLSKERFISAVLDNAQSGTPLHKELSERGIQLFFEPGRALLDNCGVTIARVAYRKRDSEGNMLVGMAMNRTHLRPFRAEFCCDPIFLGQPDADAESHDEGVFFVGSLCSESDILFKRRFAMTKLPRRDDVFFFPNTAGYLAHHLEVGTHGDFLPENVLLDSETLKVISKLGK